MEEETPQHHPRWDDSTVCSHAGSLGDSRTRLSGRKALWQASVYDFNSLADYQAAAHVYRRYGFPNSDELSTAIAALEAAESGLATSSGMGAILAAVLGVCEAGDLAIVSSDAYGVTLEFFSKDVCRFGVNVQFEDVHDVQHLENAIRRHSAAGGIGRQEEIIDGTRKQKVMVFVESISNPLVKVADVRAIANVCKKYGAMLIVDNTMATPLRVKPLLEGAHLVVHSATKYIGGHDDLMAGAVVGSSPLIEQAKKLAARWGLTVAPFDAWLAIRSIHSLQVRVERAWASATTLAERIIASRLALQVNAAPRCAIICIEVPGGYEGVNRAIKSFALVKLSPSFGGTCTSVSHSASSSHKFLSPQERKRLGITDGILRISVGLENVEDIWADLNCGLLAAASISPTTTK